MKNIFVQFSHIALVFLYIYHKQGLHILKKTSSPIWGGCNKAVLTNDTGTLDTLNQISLTEAEDQNQGQDDEKSAGVGNTGVVQSRYGRLNDQAGGHLNDVGQYH